MTIAETMQTAFNDIAGTSMFGNTITVYVNTPTLNTRGDETASYDGGTATTAAVMPLSEEELQLLPEGRRADNVMLCYIKSSVTVNASDKITFNSVDYEVDAVKNFRAGDTTILKKIIMHKIHV